jgi:gluconolactonase
MEGFPDGLRVAENGNLYIAAGGIAVYSPATCAFGGSDLKTLYVTARTSVYSVRIPDKGWLQY